MANTSAGPASERGDVVYTSDADGSMDLWLMQSDGGHQAPLVAGEGLQIFPAWSPDGASLIYTGTAGTNLDTAPSDICRITLSNGRITDLTETEDTNELAPTWSPDGQHITYAADTGDGSTIFIMAADGSNPHPLLDTPGHYEWPTWSPDGTHIAFSGSPSSSEPDQVWVVDTTGGDPRALTTQANGTEEPSWSPNGRLIAYASYQNGDPTSDNRPDWNEDIYVMNSDGSDPRQVTAQPGNDHWPPAWSPDSTQLLYTSDGPDGHPDLYLVPVKDPSALPARGANLTPAAPDAGIAAWRPQ